MLWGFYLLNWNLYCVLVDFIARATMTRLQQVYSIQARTLCVDWAASAVCNLARTIGLTGWELTLASLCDGVLAVQAAKLSLMERMAESRGWVNTGLWSSNVTLGQGIWDKVEVGCLLCAASYKVGIQRLPLSWVVVLLLPFRCQSTTTLEQVRTRGIHNQPLCEQWKECQMWVLCLISEGGGNIQSRSTLGVKAKRFDQAQVWLPALLIDSKRVWLGRYIFQMITKVS